MTILSTSCKCNGCIKKYKCKDYALIIEGQRLFNKLLDKDLRQGIVVRFQTEECPYRKTDNGIISKKRMSVLYKD